MRPVLVILAGFALVALLLAWTRWLAGRRWASAGNLALGLGAAGLTAWCWPLVAHLETYDIHRGGRPIAEIFLEQAGSSRFRATLTRLPAGRMQVFEVEGDQWRLAVRSLEWTGRVTVLGLSPSYRLERLESRATGPDAGASGDQTGFDLGEARGSDLWAKVQAGSLWSRILRAGRAEGAWQPMANGARFELTLDDAGLEAKPLNAAATASLATGP